MKSERYQIVLPAWLKKSLVDAAKRKGVSMAEYIKDASKEKLERESVKRKTDAK